MLKFVIWIGSGVPPDDAKGESRVDVITGVIAAWALNGVKLVATPLDASPTNGMTRQPLKLGNPLLTSKLKLEGTFAKEYWKISL